MLKQAKFRTALVPDSDEIEPTERSSSGETFGAWRNFKTVQGDVRTKIRKRSNKYGNIIKTKRGGGCNPLIARVLANLHTRHSEGVKRPKNLKAIKEILRLKAQNDEKINCAKHDTNLSSYRLNVLSSNKKAAFTLAEVLITLGVLGVVAAVTLPTLLTNVQERVRKEQLRSAKYKLTLATDKMKSMGLLENQYPTTMAFINELKKHFKIAMVCDNNHLTDCWPSDKIEIPTTSGTTTLNVNDIKTGGDLKALGIGTRNTETVGIITADGVPMIMTYSPRCTPLDSARTYSWSTIDNKPETNATTNCISAVMDINGTGKPNRLGKDVRTWNSLLGYQRPGLQTLSYSDCQKWKNKLGINECYKDGTGERDDDYWGGAVKACYDLGLHLPSTQTLANIAGSRYGRSDITPYTVISSVQFAKSNWSSQTWMTDSLSCEEIWEKAGYSKSDQIICIDNGTSTAMGNDDTTSSLMGRTTAFSGDFWSASEVSASVALRRGVGSNRSRWGQNNRNYQGEPLCLGD